MSACRNDQISQTQTGFLGGILTSQIGIQIRERHDQRPVGKHFYAERSSADNHFPTFHRNRAHRFYRNQIKQRQCAVAAGILADIAGCNFMGCAAFFFQPGHGCNRKRLALLYIKSVRQRAIERGNANPRRHCSGKKQSRRPPEQLVHFYHLPALEYVQRQGELLYFLFFLFFRRAVIS